MDRLFVYGTLSPGKENHHLLKDIPGTWEEASVKGRLENKGWGADLGCPGIVVLGGDKNIKGHVFTSVYLPDHWLALDKFEGEDYHRILVQVRTQSGDQLPAYVYVLTDKVLGA